MKLMLVRLHEHNSRRKWRWSVRSMDDIGCYIEWYRGAWWPAFIRYLVWSVIWEKEV
jgi:hypothetical protein